MRKWGVEYDFYQKQQKLNFKKFFVFQLEPKKVKKKSKIVKIQKSIEKGFQIISNQFSSIIILM